MSSNSGPQLGSLAIQAPALKQVVRVSPSTCYDLSLFKELLKEYRKVDDSINMRLNRTTAQFRDRDRHTAGGGQGKNVQEDSCAYFWKELVESWKRRTRIVEYCVGVVDASIDGRQAAMDTAGSDPATQRRIQGEIYAEKVKRNQVHGELAVERIIRQRSLDAFRSRCRFFEPPPTDVEEREMWDTARSRR